MDYLFWTIVCFATIIWYAVVTAIVAYKGGADIKSMFSELKNDYDNRKINE